TKPPSWNSPNPWSNPAAVSAAAPGTGRATPNTLSMAWDASPCSRDPAANEPFGQQPWQGLPDTQRPSGGAARHQLRAEPRRRPGGDGTLRLGQEHTPAHPGHAR